MAERRKDRILRLCDELGRAGAPDYALERVREYAENINYCTCGHERAGVHGNGIVDRACHADGCSCEDFIPETGEARD